MTPASTRTSTSTPADGPRRRPPRRGIGRGLSLSAWVLSAHLAIGLAGCGGGDRASGDTASSSAPGAAAPAKVAPTPAVEARRLLRVGKGEEALARFTALRDADPSSVQAHRGYQDALRAIGRGAELAGEYQALRDTNAASALHHYLYGRAVITDPEAARAAFEKAKEIDPGSPWAALGLAHLSRLKGDHFKAIQVLKEAAKGSATVPEVHASLALVYAQLGMLKDAEDSYRAAEGMRPGDPEMLAGLGGILVLQKRADEGVALLQQALALDPDRPDALLALAQAHSDGRRYAESVSYIERARAAGATVDPALEANVRSKAGLPPAPPAAGTAPAPASPPAAPSPSSTPPVPATAPPAPASPGG